MLGFFTLSGIPPAPKGIPLINVCMDVDASNVLRVFAGVTMPDAEGPVVPFVEVRMPIWMMVMGGALRLFSKSTGHLLTLAPLQSILNSSSNKGM